jgi:dTDP-4-dehydrorhamnose 3,5-epimerase
MAIKLRDTSIQGCIEIELDAHSDPRGSFIKLFQLSIFKNRFPDFKVGECFISTSVKGAIRGLHFQTPPHDHDKIVFCLEGRVLDVAFDMRKSQPTYGKALAVELNSERLGALFVPRGCAHGFQALVDNSTLLYFTSTEHAPGSDTGLRWDSVGVQWPLKDPVMSDRDRSLPPWSSFISPFS